VHSRRIDPIKRSTYPFCHGDRNEIGRSRMAIACTRALNTPPNARSLSRMRYFGALSHETTSVIWRASHAAVGLRVHHDPQLPPSVAENKKCEYAQRQSLERQRDQSTQSLPCDCKGRSSRSAAADPASAPRRSKPWKVIFYWTTCTCMQCRR
jgi:hypothetical protein